MRRRVKPRRGTKRHEALRRCIFGVKHSLLRALASRARARLHLKDGKNKLNRSSLASRARARLHCNHVFCCHPSLPLFSRTFQQVPDLFAHYRGTLTTLPRYPHDTTAVPSRHYRGTLAALPRCMTGESKKCNYAVTRACARDVAVSVPSCDIRSDTRQMVWLFREKLLFLQV